MSVQQPPVPSTVEQVRSADGTRIGFERLGAGPPLVVVHGGTADRSRWAPLAPKLAEHRTVLLVDRRGRGSSGDNTAEDYRLDREVRDVLAVVEAVGAPAAVLGHSYGALCSLEALRLTDRIERALLYEPPFSTPGLVALRPEVIDRMQHQLDAGDRTAALETMLVGGAGVDRPTLDIMRRAPAWAARVAAVPTIIREARAVNAYRLDPVRFAALDVPVRFLVGTESPAHLRAATAAAHAAVPGSDVVELPGQAHTAMDSAPQLFLDEVLRFLR
jgi:pimeloyl-ACP methyl ester carboxylesterase